MKQIMEGYRGRGGQKLSLKDGSDSAITRFKWNGMGMCKHNRSLETHKHTHIDACVRPYMSAHIDTHLYSHEHTAVSLKHQRTSLRCLYLQRYFVSEDWSLLTGIQYIMMFLALCSICLFRTKSSVCPWTCSSSKFKLLALFDMAVTTIHQNKYSARNTLMDSVCVFSYNPQTRLLFARTTIYWGDTISGLSPFMCLLLE